VRHQLGPALPAGVTGRKIEDTHPLSPHLHPKTPQNSTSARAPPHKAQYAPQGILACSPALTKPTSECTSHDPVVVLWEVVTSALRARCTTGPHDANAPPTTPTELCERAPNATGRQRLQDGPMHHSSQKGAEQKQKSSSSVSSSQGSHSQGRAKEAHIGTERGHDIYSRTKRALPPHTRPIARRPTLSPPKQGHGPVAIN
jgi:hypothetical protein